MSLNKKVLVTGANGYVALHLVDLLLRQGYSVRGTVRTQKKADQVISRYPQYKDKLEFVIVEDISHPNAFEGKLDDSIYGIFHVASPYTLKIAVSNKVDLLDPAINGTVGILSEAMKFPTIKRVVITSSFAAILGGKPSSHVYTEEDWNPTTWEQALTSDALTAYMASKKFSERAAWDFVEKNKPHFDIATLCPPMVYGPILHHIDKLEELRTSTGFFYDIAGGKKDVETPAFDLYVDVRDLAQAHLLALEKPEASNQRYLVSNGNYDWQEMVDLAHKLFPGQTRAHVGKPGTHPPKGILADASKARTQLGLTYIPKEDTFRDAIAQMIQFEKEGK